MKKLNLFIFISFLSMGIIIAQSITVTTPNGGENWKIGKPYMIHWNSSGISGPVGIKLFKNNASLGYIAQNVPNTGSFNWTISNVIGIGLIKAGSDYKIQVKVSGVAGDISNGNFTISTPGPQVKVSMSVNEPHGGGTWEQGKSYNIKWFKTGTMINFVKISLMGPSGSTLKHMITVNTPNNGNFNWHIPKTVPAGKYVVLVETIDNQVSDTSNVFNIKKAPSGPGIKMLEFKGKMITPSQNILKNNPNIFLASQNIKIYSPRSSHTWKPLQTYKITFDVMKKSFPYSSFAFKIDLIYAYASGIAHKIKEKLYDANMKRIDKNTFFTYQYTWKFQGSYNIKPGKYKVRIASMVNPSLKQDSEMFTIESKISDKTAFLGESKADITIEDVYYDDFKQAFMVRVKNTGFNTYNGPLTVSYGLTVGQSTHASCSGNIKISDSKKFTNVTLGKFQVKTFKFMDWKCFGLRSDYLPKNAPIKYSVFVYSNNQSPGVSGYLCKTKKPDIILLGDVLLFTKNNNTESLGSAISNKLSPSSFNWISKTQFKTKIQVKVANWGCKAKTFPINIHMDGPYLNGKKGITIATITLAPSEEKWVTSKDIIFSIPKVNKHHRFLLVAYQGEKNDQGYPNSYMNNFELAFIKLGGEGGGTVRGTGW